MDGTAMVKKEPTVYKVLLHLLYAVSAFRPLRSEQATETLFSLTGSKRKKLTAEETADLEDAFQTMYHELSDLFIRDEPSFKADASHFMNIPELIDIVLQLERNSIDTSMSRKEVNALQAPVNKFLKVLNISRRRTTL